MKVTPLGFAILCSVVAELPAQADWVDITGSAGQPPVRYHHAAAYDGGRDVVVMFGGGSATTGILGDTWEWHPLTGWSQAATVVAPTATYGCMLAYDEARAATVLFGGWDGANLLAQLWSWNGSAWSVLSPPTSPSARYFPGFVYDPTTASILMFGGHDGTHRNDTWSWNGSTWTQLTANGQAGSPSGRRGPGMARDSHRDVVVLFGGLDGFSPNATALADTWEWSGVWQQRSPITVPSARGHCGMAFDEFRGRIVMNGGDRQGVYLDDTWEYDGVDWLQRAPATAITHSTGSSLTYDPVRRRCLRYGGFDPVAGSTAATWIYESAQPAGFAGFGSGCGPSYVPGLAVAEPNLPWAGSGAIVDVDAPVGLPVLLAIGLDNVSSPLGPLPLALAGFGAPGCDLLVDPQGLVFLGPAPAQWSTGTLPAAAVGAAIYVQAATLDPAANALGIAASRGGSLTIGQR
ncbi:MAG: hypothetical protein KDE27_22945 [Planctomycetes bacterium]|nr:hypothetical protein [Planctomycetota bacterium]